MENRAIISIHDLTIGFERNVLVRDLSLEIARGEILAILGPSGAGKTTLLRTIAGFHRPSAGAVTIDSVQPKSLFGTGRLQYLHQQPSLWEHLTVWENIKLVLQLLAMPATTNRIFAIIGELGLVGSERKYPKELSQGMRARLALARAFAKPPEVLLVDEPFGSLDPIRRENLNRRLRSLSRETNCTIVMVTHDVIEAIRFSSRILVFPAEGSRLVEVAVPIEQPNVDPNALPPAFLGARNRILDLIGTSQL